MIPSCCGPYSFILRPRHGQKQSSAPDSNVDDDINEDCNLAEVKEATGQIAAHFRIPLEAKGVLLLTLHDEVKRW